jgi:glycosyltransferase involved in cell wall biosynthesis
MSDATNRRIRILHVVGGMNRGGVETWLMHLLRHLDRQRFHMDFLVHTSQPCAYDYEIAALGSRIIHCFPHTKPWRYARSLMRILREDGPYDVVHSHVHHFTGLLLYIARRAGVPVRIAHSHSDTSLSDGGAGPGRLAYLRLMKNLIRTNATGGLAASRKAAAALYGHDWENDSRWRLLYCGIDLEPFRQKTDPGQVRAELSIPSDARVIGHVGRFHEVKNHSFLTEIAFEIAKREPRMRLLLIGDGPLRSQVEQKTAQLGLNGKVIFAGLRSDVPRLMLGAMDIFVMPSLYEGLPLVGIEAQAAGLPLLISDTITDELPALGQTVHRLSLNTPPSVWADAALRHCSLEKDHHEALRKIDASRFSITRSAAEVERCYYG